MRIQNNLMAMNTHRQLSVNNLNQTKSTEKLSSGYRINRAADDAAGLYISEKMRSQIRGLNQASANAQDGISLVQAAEGALQETHSILQRMRELSVKAANDVNETEDRGAIQAEIDQLTKEVDRIAFTTEFNKKILLDGSLQNGVKSAKTISGSGVETGIVASAGFTPGMYNVEVDTPGEKTQVEIAIGDKASDASVAGETIVVRLGGDIIVNGANLLEEGNLVTFTASGDVDQDNATLINMLKDVLTSSLDKFYDVSSVGNKIVITAKRAEDTTYDGIAGMSFAITSKTADNTAGTSALSAAGTDVVAAGADAVIHVNGTAADDGSKYGEYVFKDGTETLTFRMSDITKFSSAVISVNAGQSLVLQVGANTSVDQTIGLAVRSLSAASLGIDNLSVHSNEASRASVASIEKAIAGVSEQRSLLGAVQNRLEHTVANLDTVSENLQAAESRIRDVDMAKEMMTFTKNNILSQAATAMLAQANQAPQTVLQLLR